MGRSLVARTQTAGWSAILVGIGASLYVFAVLTPLGQRIDGMSMGGFAWMADGWRTVGGWLRDEFTLVLAALAVVAVVATVIVRRRIVLPLVCLVALYLVVIVNTLLRDHLLPRPEFGMGGPEHNTFPSGHVAGTVTACALLLICGAALSPGRAAPRWAAWAAWAASWLVAVFSVVVYAHRGSDVIGGAFLAAAAVVWALPPGTLPRWRDLRRRAHLGTFCAVVAIAALVVESTGSAALMGVVLVAASGAVCAVPILLVTFSQRRTGRDQADMPRPGGGTAPRTSRLLP